MTRIRVSAILVVGLALAGTAGAQVINGCADVNKGNLRVVKPNEPCGNNEYAVIWNAVGPQGPQGPQGVAGPTGPTGAPGAAAPVAQTPPPVVIGTLTVTGFTGTSNVYEIGGGVTNTGTAYVGGGIGSGKASFSDIEIVRETDALSVELFESASLGKHFRKCASTWSPPARVAAGK